MMTPLVSVIVPAHNAAGTLGRCLASLIAQTYGNLEILVVVNACVDETNGVAGTFAKRDSRVKVICTDASGVSHARNLGLSVADGDYIGFTDADDWVEPGMFEAMATAAVGLDADMVCCGRTIDSARGTSLIPAADHALEISADDFYYGVLMDPYGGSVCNKLFSRRAIGSRRFDESMAIIEDSAFCCSLAVDGLRFVAIPGCYYHYVSNEESATHDLSRLVTKDGKWAYLEGVLTIKSRATNETQRRISEEVSCAFAATGVRELAGKAGCKDLHRELRRYLKQRLGSFVNVEPNRLLKAKTMAALFAPRLWAFASNCVKRLQR